MSVYKFVNGKDMAPQNKNTSQIIELGQKFFPIYLYLQKI